MLNDYQRKIEILEVELESSKENLMQHQDMSECLKAKVEDLKEELA
jgi:hypothetical protein